jgi:phage tail sheath protein FI
MLRQAESLPALHLETGAELPTIQKAPTGIGAFIGITQDGPLNRAVRLTGIADFLTVFGDFNPAVEAGYAVSQFFKNGGREAWFVRIGRDSRASDIVGNSADGTGIFALDAVDLFNLLCIPALSHLPDWELQSALAPILQYCQSRRGMLLFDLPPELVEPNGVKRWLAEHESLRHPNVISFFPRLKIVDPLNMNLHRLIGPSGTIAGAFARHDFNHQVWSEPCGGELPLLGVMGLGYSLSDEEAAFLNSLGINGLRKFGEFGTVIAGSRTTIQAEASDSNWRSIAARRLSFMIQESLHRGTEWVSDRWNDEKLWEQLREQVSAFMQQLYEERAFQGTNPADSFFVKCDAETNPSAEQDRGRVLLWAGFAPSEPGKFVILKLCRRAKKQRLA